MVLTVSHIAYCAETQLAKIKIMANCCILEPQAIWSICEGPSEGKQNDRPQWHSVSWQLYMHFSPYQIQHPWQVRGKKQKALAGSGRETFTMVRQLFGASWGTVVDNVRIATPCCGISASNDIFTWIVGYSQAKNMQGQSVTFPN